MEIIRALEKSELVQIVKQHLPNIKVNDICVWIGKISKQQFKNILNNIRERKYIEDALTLLRDPSFIRQSISYSIAYIGCEEAIGFEVVDTRREGLLHQTYNGYIFTEDREGRKVIEITLEQLSLNPFN